MPGLLRRLYEALTPSPPLPAKGRRVAESFDLGDRFANAGERLLGGYGGGFGGPDRLYLPYGGGPTDRKGGGLRPILSTEQDLALMRGASRLLCDANQFAIGFLGRLTEFTVGDGFTWAVSVKGGTRSDPDGNGRPGTQDPLVKACQDTLDDWRQMAEWSEGEEDRESESFRRYRRDGEVFLRFFAGGPSTDSLPPVRFVEPEHVVAPSGQTDGPWSWGIETDPDDVETRLGVFVRDPGSPDLHKDRGTYDGEVVPYARILHLKCNTDRVVKRGLPDFWPVHDDLEFCRKVLRSMGTVAAIQAKIAYIRQHAPGVTAAQVTPLIEGLSDRQSRDLRSLTDRSFPTQIGADGEVLDISNGMQHVPGPSATGIPGWIQLEQACLRGAGSRWGMPEFFSGDASNQNFASILVAGGPFERATKARQKAFAGFQKRIALKVLAFAEAAGRLPEGTCRRVIVTVTPPGVSIADPAGEEQVRDTRFRNGIISKATYRAQAGLDDAVEKANIRAENDEDGDDQGQGGGGMPPTEPPGGGGGFGESWPGVLSESDYDTLSEAGRAGLVKKVVTNKVGNKQTVYVRGHADDAKPAESKGIDAALGTAADAAPAPKPTGRPAVADTLATIRGHLDTTDTSLHGPGTADKIAAAIAGHSHAELAEIRKELGIKASGKKADVVAKMATRAALGKHDRSDRSKFVNDRMTVDDAHDALKAQLDAPEIDRDALAALGTRMAQGLSVKELGEVKKRLGLRAGGGKAAMVDKLISRAVSADAARKAAPAVTPPDKSPTGVDPSPTGDKIPGVGTQSAAPELGEKTMPSLKGTEKQIQWAGQIRGDLVAAWGDHPADTTGKVKDAASVVAGMGHAKQFIDLKDVVGDPKQLVATVARGREIAAAVAANAGKVPEKDVTKTLGHVTIETAAVAYHLLNPDAPTYDGYGQTAAPRFKMWLTGKLPLPKGGA